MTCVIGRVLKDFALVRRLVNFDECRAGGLRTSLYTSPHLVSFRERIRVDGAMIGETEVATGLARIREIIADWELAATFFEIVTALALWKLPRNFIVSILMLITSSLPGSKDFELGFLVAQHATARFE